MKINNIIQLRKLFALSSVASAMILTGCGGGEDEKKTSTPDTPAVISIENTSINEGNKGSSKSLSIPIRLSKKSAEDIELGYSFEDISAINGEDYSAKSGKIIIPSGSRRAQIDVLIHGDDKHEPDEHFKVHLDSVTNAEINDKNSSATITILNDDSVPTLTFDTVIQSATENVGVVTVPVSLSAESGFDVTATVSLSGTALLGDDYTLNETEVYFSAGETFREIELSIIEDPIPEGGETIFVTLEQIENADLISGEGSSHTVVILGDIGLNDTGLTKFSDGVVSNLSFEPVSHPGQDASYGRDVNQAGNNDHGHAGFSFTKIDFNGNPLPATSENWSCVQDNVTGLVWENKQPDFTIKKENSEDDVLEIPTGDSWRAGNFTYGWHNSNIKDNGGSSGYQRTAQNSLPKDRPVTVTNGYCGFTKDPGRKDKIYCDTQAYITEMNRVGACGFNDWRAPEASELRSIANYEQPEVTTVPESNFFSNLKTNTNYLSATPGADNEASAWCYDFGDGHVKLCQKGVYQSFIAVRNKK